MAGWQPQDLCFVLFLTDIVFLEVPLVSSQMLGEADRGRDQRHGAEALGWAGFVTSRAV